MDSKRLHTLWEALQLEHFRYRQLQKAIFQEHISCFEDILVLKKETRFHLKKETLLQFTCQQVFKSKEENCYKALLKLTDNNHVETVLMSPKKGLWTVCISSQVGCSLGCTFCATGSMGLIRNLTTEEITDQVLFWLQYIKKQNLQKLKNIVYMGMGEPLQNKKEVFASLEELTNPNTFNFASRHISLSTAGLVPEIKEFSAKFPQINLAVSLHNSNDIARSTLMPINLRYNLKSLHSILEEVTLKNKRKIFIEYILMKNENDSYKDALSLAQYIHSFSLPYLFQVNIIVYNQTESKHQQSSKESVRSFKKHLLDHRIFVTIRKNLGRDIDGACGQLVYHNNQNSTVLS